MSKKNAPDVSGTQGNAGAIRAAASTTPNKTEVSLSVAVTVTVGGTQAEPARRAERRLSRTVSGNGVVVTYGDGDAFLDDQDTNP